MSHPSASLRALPGCDRFAGRIHRHLFGFVRFATVVALLEEVGLSNARATARRLIPQCRRNEHLRAFLYDLLARLAKAHRPADRRDRELLAEALAILQREEATRPERGDRAEIVASQVFAEMPTSASERYAPTY